MWARWSLVVLVLVIGIAEAGCAPKEMFNCLDHCYLADWTNHHSCVSCCKHNGDDYRCQ